MQFAYIQNNDTASATSRHSFIAPVLYKGQHPLNQSSLIVLQHCRSRCILCTKQLHRLMSSLLALHFISPAVSNCFAELYIPATSCRHHTPWQHMTQKLNTSSSCHLQIFRSCVKSSQVAFNTKKPSYPIHGCSENF